MDKLTLPKKGGRMTDPILVGAFVIVGIVAVVGGICAACNMTKKEERKRKKEKEKLDDFLTKVYR